MSDWWSGFTRAIEEGVRDGFKPVAPSVGRGILSFSGSERQRELSDTQRAWGESGARWEASAASGISSYDLALDLVRALVRRSRSAPAVPILVACAQATEALFDDEDIGDLEPDWPLIAEDLSVGANFRAMMERRNRWANDFDRMRHAVSEPLADVFEHIFDALPQCCFDEWEEGDGFGVPLIELVDRPVELIERLVLLPYTDDTLRYDLFQKLRRTLERNLLVASGYPPTADPREVQDRLIGPSKQKNKTPTELAELYLSGTPFRSLFELAAPFRLSEEARFEHCHIVGGTGHGKTQLMQQMILADLVAAQRERRSIVVIDSQGDLINKLMRLALFAPDAEDSLADRLIVIDPSDVEFPAALNLFDMHLARLQEYRPVDRERVLNGVVELYETFFGALLGAELTQKQGVVFKYLARLMLTIPGATIHTLMRLMEDGRPFRPYMDALEGSAQHFFASEFFDPSFSATKKQILKRLWGVLSTPAFERMFTQKENKLDLYAAMNDGKIILVNTAKDLLKTEGSQLFGRFFISMIAQAALERSTLHPDDRTPTFVYVDEAQEYFDDTIETILNQARKYCVGLTLAHQTLDQLTPRLRAALLANTSVKLVGGVSARDARALCTELRTTSDFIESMRRRRDRTEFAAWVKQETPQAIRLTVPLGHLERQPILDEEELDQLLATNRLQYCGSLKEIGRYANSEAIVPPDPVAEEPSQLDSSRGSSEQTPAPDRSVTADSRPRRSEMRTKPGNGGPRHKYLQTLIKELAEQQGLRAKIEATIGANCADVFVEGEGRQIVFEVCVTTSAEWERDNIISWLRAGMPQVALVLGKTVKNDSRYRAAVLGPLGEPERERVTILTPQQIPDFIASLAPPTTTSESTVRGYKVRVTRNDGDFDDAQVRRNAIGKLLARSLKGSDE